MEVQQLKLLAGRVRTLLQQSNHLVGHSQSLDLIAALPGLRNWPEVQAFPDRVIACELDGPATGRLAFRLKKRFQLDLSPYELSAALSPSGENRSSQHLQVWPTGPRAGVYVTTSQTAINALLERYEEATDGALVYAERAGNHAEGAIDLGDDGLWSKGVYRVPSGTLFVVGPVELDQQSWTESAGRVHMACLHALTSEHRVAVLVSTPAPGDVFRDIQLMVQSVQDQGDDCDAALTGVVTEDGELDLRRPFAQPRLAPARIAGVATADAIPGAARVAFKDAVSKLTSGLLLVGSEVIETHAAIELVAASLALTDHAGPAARIMPRHRGTPAKDWLVPEAIKQLPFLPSIESAYDRGYRRMVFTPGYSSSEALLKFGSEVLFIGGTYGFDVVSVFTGALRDALSRDESDLLRHVIALLGVMPIDTEHGAERVSELFVMPPVGIIEPMRFEDIERFLVDNRTLSWQDDLERLIDSGAVTAADLKEAKPRNADVRGFLAQRHAGNGRSSGSRH